MQEIYVFVAFYSFFIVSDFTITEFILHKNKESREINPWFTSTLSRIILSIVLLCIPWILFLLDIFYVGLFAFILGMFAGSKYSASMFNVYEYIRFSMK